MIDDSGKTLLTQALARCESNGLGFTEIPLIYTHQIKELLGKIELPEELSEKLKKEAKIEHISPDQLVTQIVTFYFMEVK